MRCISSFLIRKGRGQRKTAVRFRVAAKQSNHPDFQEWYWGMAAGRGCQHFILHFHWLDRHNSWSWLFSVTVQNHNLAPLPDCRPNFEPQLFILMIVFFLHVIGCHPSHSHCCPTLITHVSLKTALCTGLNSFNLFPPCILKEHIFTFIVKK